MCHLDLERKMCILEGEKQERLSETWKSCSQHRGNSLVSLVAEQAHNNTYLLSTSCDANTVQGPKEVPQHLS